MNTRNKLRTAGLFAVTAGLVFTWACLRRPMKVPVPDTEVVEQFVMPQSAQRDVDILFMIDNSHSMAVHQERIMQNFPVLMNTLAQMSGGLPNVHIGVVTSDLGAGNHTGIRFCEQIGGDQGILGMSHAMEDSQAGGPPENRVRDRGALCIGPGERYIVDVEPVGCEINKNPEPDSHTCGSHACGQQHCDDIPGQALTYYENEFGCPRCKNYEGELPDVFSCYADVGIHGCGFEQQLEAVRKALDVNATPENAGFLRESAFLAVVAVTDEDDCTSAVPDVMYNPDPTQDNIDSQLGYLHSFRCFEFGINCHVNDRHPGERLNCTHERSDPNMMLHPVDRYTSFLEAIKDPLMLVVGSIAAPVPEVIMVGLDDRNRPMLMPSCHPPDSEYGADPAVRVKAFTDYFNTPDDMQNWAYVSVCETDFSSSLRGIADKIVEGMAEKCPVQPFAGCPQGPPGTFCSPCLPRCTIYDIERRGLDEEKQMEVVWCGRVCQDGLCTEADMNPCDFDEHGFCHCPDGQGPTVFGPDRQVHCAPLLYHDGSPEISRDPRLNEAVPRQEPPCQGEGCIGRTSACWYMSANTACPHRAGFRIVRADDPPPRTFADGRCSLVPAMEVLCNDGIDNDEDCYTDEEDPDCFCESDPSIPGCDCHRNPEHPDYPNCF